MAWVKAEGRGTIYSATTVHVAVLPDLEPPYVVAVVELDEGPRITTNIVGPDAARNCRIGRRVQLAWRDRAEGSLPLPVFALEPGSCATVARPESSTESQAAPDTLTDAVLLPSVR
jgi:hypothetical protein